MQQFTNQTVIREREKLIQVENDARRQVILDRIDPVTGREFMTWSPQEIQFAKDYNYPCRLYHLYPFYHVRNVVTAKVRGYYADNSSMLTFDLNKYIADLVEICDKQRALVTHLSTKTKEEASSIMRETGIFVSMTYDNSPSKKELNVSVDDDVVVDEDDGHISSSNDNHIIDVSEAQWGDFSFSSDSGSDNFSFLDDSVHDIEPVVLPFGGYRGDCFDNDNIIYEPSQEDPNYVFPLYDDPFFPSVDKTLETDYNIVPYSYAFVENFFGQNVEPHIELMDPMKIFPSLPQIDRACIIDGLVSRDDVPIFIRDEAYVFDSDIGVSLYDMSKIYTYLDRLYIYNHEMIVTSPCDSLKKIPCEYIGLGQWLFSAAGGADKKIEIFLALISKVYSYRNLFDDSTIGDQYIEEISSDYVFESGGRKKIISKYLNMFFSCSSRTIPLIPDNRSMIYNDYVIRMTSLKLYSRDISVSTLVNSMYTLYSMCRILLVTDGFFGVLEPRDRAMMFERLCNLYSEIDARIYAIGVRIQYHDCKDKLWFHILFSSGYKLLYQLNQHGICTSYHDLIPLSFEKCLLTEMREGIVRYFLDDMLLPLLSNFG